MTTKNVKVMRFKFIQTVACYCINAATLKGLPDKVIEPLTFFNCEHSSHLLEGGEGKGRLPFGAQIVLIHSPNKLITEITVVPPYSHD